MVIKELDTMDGTLNDVRQQNEYKQAFDEDNNNTDRMRQLYSYEHFLDYPDSQTNKDQLNSSCNTNDQSVIIDFYDKELNDLSDGTRGHLISTSWKTSTIKSMAKLYLLKMNIAGQLDGMCKALLHDNDPDLLKLILFGPEVWI